ncbi:MAG: hypothetical protein FWC00_00590 [Firmicutes bacterium]|nr:hypothetical protein [Bacillota bacterium]
MEKLVKMRQELEDFKRSVGSINAFVNCKLPEKMYSFDFDELQDYLKYLCGYIDCMIDFELPLVLS